MITRSLLLGILVRRYEKELMGHALTLLGNREDALDVLQESFVKAFKSISRFQTGRKFYPWIYGIMRNLAVDRFRERARDRRHQDALWQASELDTRLNGVDDPASAGFLWKALGKLSQEDREIIVLKHLGCRKYDEISEILQMARGTVMSRLYRARQKLRQLVLTLETNFTDGAKLR